MSNSQNACGMPNILVVPQGTQVDGYHKIAQGTIRRSGYSFVGSSVCGSNFRAPQYGCSHHHHRRHYHPGFCGVPQQLPCPGAPMPAPLCGPRYSPMVARPSVALASASAGAVGFGASAAASAAAFGPNAAASAAASAGPFGASAAASASAGFLPIV